MAQIVAKKPLALHWKILLGLIIGVFMGIIAQNSAIDSNVLQIIISYVSIIGKWFLNLIMMIVIPLLFCAIINGIQEVGDISKLGKLGIRTLIYTLIVTSISVFIGIALFSTIQPGKMISEQNKQNLLAQFKAKAEEITDDMNKTQSLPEIASSIIPQNPFKEMVFSFDKEPAGGKIIAVMFFAIMFGVGLVNMPNNKSKPLMDFFDSLFEVNMKIISYAMKLAPFGVAALMFKLTATTGLSIIGVLLIFMMLTILALALHLLGTYSLILKFYCGQDPFKFFKDIKDVMITAFSTSSSNATLPTALIVTQEKRRIPKHISNFVLSIGSTANQNGTALYEGVTVLFLAQLFNVDLSISQQIYVVVFCIMAGVGTAGVPGGSLPVIAIILASIGVPPEGLAIIVGVDRILDMCRTVINVSGDIVCAEVVHSWELKKSL